MPAFCHKDKQNHAISKDIVKKQGPRLLLLTKITGSISNAAGYFLQYTVYYECLLHYIGHRAILVGSHLTLLSKPYDQNNSAYKRDKCKKHQPSRLSYVVQTAHAQSETGEKQCKTDNTVNNRPDCRLRTED